ncbi:MAG: hypothetical protein K6E85_00350 [Lachnospiraceae bacterium]|nr:hypothetical protein [Lachnospiraceae bacterium]
MRYFFIDLENVRNEGLEGVLSLNEKDMVYIFYSENAFSMAIPTMESITNSKCSSKFIKTNYIGKNAMDFQIVSLFGAMIERCKDGSFYIISKDNGFRSAVSFCESFFSEYPIKCGVYPRIISALAAESKNKISGTASDAAKKNSGKVEKIQNKDRSAGNENKEDKESQNWTDATLKENGDATGTTEGNGRRSRRRHKKQEKHSDDKQTIENNNPSVDAEMADGASTVIEASPVDSSEGTVENENRDQKKSRSRRSRRKSGKRDNNREDDAVKDNSEDDPDVLTSMPEDETDRSDNDRDSKETPGDRRDMSNDGPDSPNNFGYIYELLKEYLSERTIDIYAGYIDEGIAKSSNRDELQKYFRECLGDDEGEALFKVVRSDYEKYKQNRPKKTSRARRHRPRKKNNIKESPKE